MSTISNGVNTIKPIINTLNVPDTLTIEQIMQLKNLLKTNTSKKQLAIASARRYNLSDKGIILFIK